MHSKTKMAERIKLAVFSEGPERAADELAAQIIAWTAGTGALGGVVGLSGGIDSTTVAYLCHYAFTKYAAAKGQDTSLGLLGLILPSKVNSADDERDGLWVAETLGIEHQVVPIQPIAEAYKAAIPDAFRDRDFDVGNLYSEIRATLLSRIGAGRGYRIMGTGNRDEDYVLGYFTKRGDGAVDNNILGELPKRLVRELALWLGVPEDRVNRTPTAGLWVNQTDEGELGYSYDQAEVIQNGFDDGLTVAAIHRVTHYPMGIIRDVQQRHLRSAHKRQVPPVGHVSLRYE